MTWLPTLMSPEALTVWADEAAEADVIRMTRLPGPTAREAEKQAAEYIEGAVALYDGRDLGVRKPRDARDGSGLRVDFTYNVATPPVAMEITALVKPDVKALDSELFKLETELRGDCLL